MYRLRPGVRPAVLQNKGPRGYEKVKNMQMPALEGQNPEECANKRDKLPERGLQPSKHIDILTNTLMTQQSANDIVRPCGWGEVAQAVLLLQLAEAAHGEEWRYYGGDAGGTRHSALTQINRENVGR